MSFIRGVSKIETLKTIIAQYARDKKYFSIQELKSYLKYRGISYTDESVKKYLYNLKKEKQIFSAGRGWYSTINAPFVLDTKPIEEIVKSIQKNFPLLSFSCWSTEQLISYFHHLPTNFFIFVYSEKDFLPSLFEYLQQKNTPVFLNPLRIEVKKLFFEKRNVILRPSISREPVKDHYATIEKILIDLFVEKEKLFIIDDWDYLFIFKNILTNYRISVASLIKYAERRKVTNKIQKLIEEI